MTGLTREKFKTAAGIVAALCLAIFVLQNLEQVEVSFLTITVALPAAVLVLLSAALGAGLGYFAARRKRSPAVPAPTTPVQGEGPGAVSREP